MQWGLCVLVYCLVGVVHSKTMDTEYQTPDVVSTQVFEALAARVDLLEARDRIHQAEMDKLRHDHHTDMLALRHEHQTEMAELHQKDDINEAALRHDVSAQHARILELEMTVRRQKDRIDELEHLSKNDQQASQTVPATMQSEGYKEISNNTMQRVLKMKREPAEKETPAQRKKMIRQVNNENPIAFFATLAHDLVHMGQNQPITFDHVFTNLGNAYNPHAGIFVAPVSGTYVFSVTLRTYDTNNAHYTLTKNLEVVTNMFVHGAHNSYDTTSNTVVLHLSKNDDVMIRHISTDHALRGGDYTMFSGFLLVEDFADSTPAIVGK